MGRPDRIGLRRRGRKCPRLHPGVAQLDLDTAALVQRTLRRDPSLAPISRRVHSRVNKGALTLRGYVDTVAAKQNIIDRVSKLPGVDAVDDQIEIRP